MGQELQHHGLEHFCSTWPEVFTHRAILCLSEAPGGGHEGHTPTGNASLFLPQTACTELAGTSPWLGDLLLRRWQKLLGRSVGRAAQLNLRSCTTRLAPLSEKASDTASLESRKR